MKPIRLVRGFLTVGMWTLLSRVLGFVRDMMIAAFLGAGPVADAFFVAFSLPNMFRRFFAEGALNMSFVPIFAKKLEADENPQAFAREAMGGLTTILIVLTLLASVTMPWLVLAMASGFAEDERLGLATNFGRIAFPYILFISLSALLSGVLNASGRFAASAAAPVLLNIIFVGGMMLADTAGWDVGQTLAWCVPVAGIAQLALVWIAASRAGFRLYPVWPRLSPDMRRLARVAGPAMLAGGVVQVNLLVGRQVASWFQDGAISILNYADRLYQLPLGVVGIAIGIVLLPDLARRLRAGDDDGARHSFSRAAEFALALTVPPAVALMVIAGPIVSVLYQRGAFGPEAAASTALAVAIYGAGLPAFVLQKVLQPLFYARENTRAPFNYALVAMALNAVLAIGLAPFIGFYAAAVATTLASWAMVAQLWWGARAMGDAARFDLRFFQRLPRILLASAGMGGFVWGLSRMLDSPLHEAGLRYGALAIVIFAGIGAYFAIGLAIGAFKATDFKSAVKRG
ncbi:murein biosynthesis integral membrane protein MurJ [Thioclava sp. SK-1]|uniref:murein biosynthesis integral membrane protein MurJ n=1 Tax=Thioclava sp. SK-1 TaxID=1889770 RepID=UPI000825C4CC|nr:murein biosynthesis integral membrane protein MurJ [Thioclava sp. SK-1]OCX61115.1 murein biosynthesis integral membrane protein MurJ [Thioclava sp. SK-1]